MHSPCDSDEFHVYYMHTQATKGLTHKEVHQRIQDSLMVSNEQTHQLITSRIACMQQIEKKLKNTQEYVLNNVKGERGVMCLRACWGGVFVQYDITKKKNQPCCFSRSKGTSLNVISILYESRDKAEITDVFYVKRKWLPLLEGFIFLSHLREYCSQDPSVVKEADLLKAFNDCTKALCVLSDQL